MEGWEGDEVGFVEILESIEGMTDLFDMYCAREGCFLGIVALQLERKNTLGGSYQDLERHTCTPCLSLVIQ